MWHGHVLILTSFLTRFPAFQTNQLFDPCQYATTAISNSSTQSTTTLKRLVANMSTWPPSVIGHYNRWESKPNIVQCDSDTNHHIVIDENQIWDDAHQSITFRLQLQGVYVNLMFLLHQILPGFHGQRIWWFRLPGTKAKVEKNKKKGNERTLKLS